VVATTSPRGTATTDDGPTTTAAETPGSGDAGTGPDGAPGTTATTAAGSDPTATTNVDTAVTDPVTGSGTTVPTVTVPVATVAPDTTPPTTAAPAFEIQPIALGESVMLGAITNLQAGGFYVDALKGRQGDAMATLVETLRASNQIGKVMVIQIGTNGQVTSNDLQRIMAQLPPELTPTVVFLTVRAPRDWQDGNNELIRALPTTYPNVKVLDWQSASMAISICSDGIHIACGGMMAQYYANLIFDAIGRPDLDR
jgi:hypothetical protein